MSAVSIVTFESRFESSRGNLGETPDGRPLFGLIRSVMAGEGRFFRLLGLKGVVWWLRLGVGRGGHCWQILLLLSLVFWLFCHILLDSLELLVIMELSRE